MSESLSPLRNSAGESPQDLSRRLPIERSAFSASPRAKTLRDETATGRASPRLAESFPGGACGPASRAAHAAPPRAERAGAPGEPGLERAAGLAALPGFQPRREPTRKGPPVRPHKPHKPHIPQMPPHTPHPRTKISPYPSVPSRSPLNLYMFLDILS